MTSIYTEQRTEPDTIMQKVAGLDVSAHFNLIRDILPEVAAVIDENRQVIFANLGLLKLVDIHDESSLLGERPGELFDCIHSTETSQGCGTSSSCRYCGANQAIRECQMTGKPVLMECRISSGTNGEEQSYDLEVRANPLLIDAQNYILLSIKDISDSKRRSLLEEIFLHDIINRATGLNETLLKLDSSQETKELQRTINIANGSGNDLIDELLSQRALSLAERGELQLNVVRCFSLPVLNEISGHFINSRLAEGKRIFIDPFSHSVQIETDATLLKRVLINLIKNALEACTDGAVIQMGTRLANKHVKFWVNNPGVISDEIKHQIFQRSFSTHGVNRGIGTYSAKLLTTRYLKGTLSFESNVEDGTTFFIEVPIQFER